MSQIKFVMLDFDGTIADSVESVIYCSEKIFRNEGVPFDKTIVEENMGCTTRGCIALLIGRDDPELVDRLTEAYNTIYKSEGLDMIRLFDGVL